MTEVDVLVIGSGAAGEYAASYALGNGREVAMIEKAAVGGSCIFNACIPTKSLVQSARLYKRMRCAGALGLPVLRETADYSKVKSFKDQIVSGIGYGRAERWIGRGVKLYKGTARFRSPHEVEVSGEIITADKIIIATGSRPAVPPIPGLQETGFITNYEALELEKPPEKLVIIGGGAVGAEFAQVFSAFGSQVHIVEAAEHILANEDEEISSAVEKLFTGQGITVSTSAKVISVDATSSGKRVNIQRADGSTSNLECSEILVATGRKPNIEELNLSAAGIESGKRGITVDTSLQTNVPHIWAAGDVNGTYLFTYVANEQGKTAALNATSPEHHELEYRVLPRATFCDPEVASVGLTEKQARDNGLKVIIGRFKFADLTRAIVSVETDGFIKVVAEEGSGRIIGGHIVGAEASTLIHEIAAAMAANTSVQVIGSLLHSYPTFSEGVRYACQAAK
ncbi:dihydrolipoyl dehydrogenase [Dehalogenimonas formicexedens]|uniref:Dihydrolipoyl dehydrogenase n=1 Tax=Dehalogenimonas formicexedens TaxID=1839801 RepID=A0A1P8F5G8_9CHLR|nr:FAD-dependent oxidoreductase [Dehalogenimonas formicexedens]APV43721.1 dihydrolipoyl dehydrogenase [Dehalogenimonas formicexedens]